MTMPAAETTPQFPEIVGIDRSREARLRERIDAKAKPPGSLGRLEDLAIRLGLIQDTLAPTLGPATLIIFAGDHGLNDEGVSRYPSAVTAAMVRTFLAGRASANALARAVGADVIVVDAGVDADLPADPALRDEKVRRGSRNAAREPALTPAEVQDCLTRGARLAGAAIDRGADAIALGEMGIGNTASASLLMHRLLPAPLAECIGIGAGHDAAGLAHKQAVLERAAARARAEAPFAVLCEFGGLEIAMMAGAVLGTAARRRPVIVDGFIGSAAALAAIRLKPEAAGYCIFAHRSAEAGHARMLAELGVTPLLDLGLRLGEGTGALLAIPLLRSAAAIPSEIADLSEVLAGGP